MRQLTEADYRQVLTSLGLSQESLDYISTRRDPVAATRAYWTGIAAYFLLLIGTGAGWYFLMRHLLFYDLMQSRTQGMHALFYDSIWGVHLFPVIFLSMLLPSYIIYSLLDKFPRAAELVALKSIDDMVRRNLPHRYITAQRATAAGIEYGFFNDETFKKLPIHEGLRYLNRKSIGWTKWGSILLAIPTVFLLAMDAANYTIVIPDGVKIVPYSRFEPLDESWDDVSRVETGCYSRGSGSRLQLTYDILFKDGNDVDLFEAQAMGEQLVAIEQVNAALRKRNKPFRRANLPRSSEPFFSKDCFSEMKKQYPGKESRLQSVLELNH